MKPAFHYFNRSVNSLVNLCLTQSQTSRHLQQRNLHTQIIQSAAKLGFISAKLLRDTTSLVLSNSVLFQPLLVFFTLFWSKSRHSLSAVLKFFGIHSTANSFHSTHPLVNTDECHVRFLIPPTFIFGFFYHRRFL